MNQQLPFLLTAYGLPHSIGFIPTKEGKSHPKPLTALDLMDAALEMGLAGVEIDLWSASPPSIEALRDALAERNLQIVVDYLDLLARDAETFRACLRDAKQAGAKVVRAVVSRVLCGDRDSLAGGWIARMNAVEERLREVLPFAEDLGLCIALENHQDVTTAELIGLAERLDSPALGVTFDTGNPLAVGEGPVEAARRLLPWIRHAHLKDYSIQFAPDGYHLFRCVAGQGCVDFPAILALFREGASEMIPGIEGAAQPTRTIRFLSGEGWGSFPAEQYRCLPEALRVLWKCGRPINEKYGSPWEHGADSEAVACEEWDLLRGSVDYFRRLNEDR